MSLYTELSRRKVFKAGAAYLVVAWLAVQAASIGFPERGSEYLSGTPTDAGAKCSSPERYADPLSPLEYQRRYVERLIAAGRSGLRYLAQGTDCVQACEEMLVDFFHASQVWGTGYAFAKQQESERLGFPTDAPTALVVREFYDYIKGWDLINLNAPAYRERVRGHFPPEVIEALWSGCFKLEGGNREVLPSDCMARLRELDVRPVLRSIRADPTLADALRFWVGQNLFAQTTFAQVSHQADAAIAAIDRDLETVR